MADETRYRVITIDRDNGDRLAYALSPDGRIISLHTPRNEEATTTNNLRSFDKARSRQLLCEASDRHPSEALPLAA